MSEGLIDRWRSVGKRYRAFNGGWSSKGAIGLIEEKCASDLEAVKRELLALAEVWKTEYPANIARTYYTELEAKVQELLGGEK